MSTTVAEKPPIMFPICGIPIPESAPRHALTPAESAPARPPAGERSYHVSSWARARSMKRSLIRAIWLSSEMGRSVCWRKTPKLETTPMIAIAIEV
jgi:hypothetical protein